MNVSTTNITRLVDGLEERDVLKQVSGERDHRVFFAQLTPKDKRLERGCVARSRPR